MKLNLLLPLTRPLITTTVSSKWAPPWLMYNLRNHLHAHAYQNPLDLQNWAVAEKGEIKTSSDNLLLGRMCIIQYNEVLQLEGSSNDCFISHRKIYYLSPSNECVTLNIYFYELRKYVQFKYPSFSFLNSCIQRSVKISMLLRRIL